MRRPNSALGAAIVAMGLSAPFASAQQSSNAPASTYPGSLPSANPDVNPVALPSASSNDPTMAARSARYLLRNGVDYLTYKQHAKALRFLRAAESRQAELDAGELKDLRMALDQAQRGLREAGDVANRNRSRRPGAMATAGPSAEPTGVAVANPIQVVEVSRAAPVAPSDPRPTPEPTPAAVREPAVVKTSATSTGPVELPPPPAALPDPSPAPAPAVADLPAPAVAELPAANPAPARSGVELPPLANEASGPVNAPAPLPESKPVTPETLPTPDPAPAPTPEPARTPTATAPPVIGLEPLPEASPAPAAPSNPAPGPAAPPSSEPPALPPVEGPAPSTKPEAPAPDPLPAPVPAADSPKEPPADGAPLSPAARAALKRLRQERGVEAPTDDRQTTPAAAPADDRQPTPPVAPEPVPEPVPAPRPEPAAVDEPRPTPAPEPAPAVSADELPTLPGQAVEAPRRSASLPSTAEPRRPLSPALEAEIARVAQRMNDAPRTPAAGQPSQLPPLPGTPPSNTPPSSDDTTGLGTSVASSTRFELTRAPSPTEAWPIRKIPVPEEFVPVPPRDWSPNRKYWQAPALCHMPLYFQDAALERYGHSVEQFVGPAGRYLSYPVDSPRESKQRYYILQPLFSSGLFALQIAALPYHMIVDPPGEAEYDLGYYRPGDRIPTDTYYLPLTGVGPPLKGRRY